MSTFLAQLLMILVLSVFYSKKATGATPAGGAEEAQIQAAQIFNFNKVISCKEAIQKVKEVSKERKFKESVEAIIRLNVDPR